MKLFARASSITRALLPRRMRIAFCRRDRTVVSSVRIPDPGYDELSDPLFVVVFLLAIAVLVADIQGGIDTSFVLEWLRSAVAMVRSFA